MFRRLLIRVVVFYQRGISPFTPATCRFTPSCSEYARQALEAHGAGRGSWLALRRILRCHPWGGHGFDPVPPPETLAEAVPKTPGGAPVATGTPSGSTTE